MIHDPSDLDGRPPVSDGCAKAAIIAIIVIMIAGFIIICIHKLLGGS